MTNEQQKIIERFRNLIKLFPDKIDVAVIEEFILKEISEAENRGEEKERKRIVKLIPSSCFSHIGEDLLEKSGIKIKSQDPKEEKINE